MKPTACASFAAAAMTHVNATFGVAHAHSGIIVAIGAQVFADHEEFKKLIVSMTP